MSQSVSTLRSPSVGRISQSRVSWGAVLSGFFVAMTVQLLITQIMVWAKFGLGKVAAPTDVASHTTAIGLWLTLSAAIGIVVGSVLASRIATSRGVANGMMHGISVWGLTAFGSIVANVTGLAALMGFGITPHSIVSYFGLTGTSSTGLAGATRTLSGWFVLELGVSFIFALAGGYAASMRGRAAVGETVVTQEEHEERRVA
jgi:hypothetical protein